MNFLEIAKKYEEISVKKLQELLRIPSVYDESTKTEDMPFGRAIEEALGYMLEMAQADGFSILKDGGYAGHIEYGSGDDVIGVLCHLDVVPAGDGWKYPPYSATIEGRKIYSRGTMDDKGPTMASYFALKMLKDLDIKLDKRVRIILGTDEETAWRGIEHYASKYGMPEIGFAPDSDFPLIYGEKGIFHLEVTSGHKSDDLLIFKGGERYNIVIDHASAQTKNDYRKAFKRFLKQNNLKGLTKKDKCQGMKCFTYEIEGIPAHAMEPYKGENAGINLAKFLNSVIKHPFLKFLDEYFTDDVYLEKLGLKYEHEEMGPITCNVGIIDLVNGLGRVCFDMRYPLGFDMDQCLNTWDEQTKAFGLTISEQSDKKPHYVDRNSSLVKTLHAAYIKYTGDYVNQPKTIGGGTYARAIKQGVAFGMEMPNQPSLAHQRDEYLNIDNFILTMAIYAEAILRLATNNETS